MTATMTIMMPFTGVSKIPYIGGGLIMLLQDIEKRFCDLKKNVQTFKNCSQNLDEIEIACEISEMIFQDLYLIKRITLKLESMVVIDLIAELKLLEKNFHFADSAFLELLMSM